jgi:hypothetical protein
MDSHFQFVILNTDNFPLLKLSRCRQQFCRFGNRLRTHFVYHPLIDAHLTAAGKLVTAGLFKNVHMQGVQKTEPRGVYEHTLSGAICSATQQTMVPFKV